VNAHRNVLRLLGATAEREADFGEALVNAASGIVTAEAKAAFDRALALDAKDVATRFYLGLAAEQDGQGAEAAKIWRGLLAEAPPDAPWRDLVRSALARIEGGAAPSASGPSERDMAAAAKLPLDQQNEMARGMVQRLADRLKDNGADADGWQRLVRSYLVLGERDRAIAAVADARRALGGAADKMQPIENLLKEQSASAPAAAIPASPETAAKQPAGAQDEMIRGMVSGLAERLKSDGSDVEGWLRLLRSYMVLGERENARVAATNARRALEREPDKLRRLDDFIKGLGLDG
jgi:cytochrome c-type biogenesis protein CcmH/NrfG